MRTEHRRHGVFPGLILILVGGGLLAREFGYLPEHVRLVDFWPLVVVVMGLSALVRARGFMPIFFALAFVAFGGVLLAGNLGLFAFHAARLWPGLLVLMGLSALLGGRRRGPWRDPPGRSRGRDPDAWKGADWSSHQGHRPQSTTGDQLNKQYTFSGCQLRIDSEAWKGGELGVTAGGVELDLRHAQLAPEGAALDLRVLMGGVDIRVPDTWQVSCDVTPLFGGADDATRTTQGVGTAPQLRVTGSVTLGGVTIRN